MGSSEPPQMRVQGTAGATGVSEALLWCAPGVVRRPLPLPSSGWGLLSHSPHVPAVRASGFRVPSSVRASCSVLAHVPGTPCSEAFRPLSSCPPAPSLAGAHGPPLQRLGLHQEGCARAWDPLAPPGSFVPRSEPQLLGVTQASQNSLGDAGRAGRVSGTWLVVGL